MGLAKTLACLGLLSAAAAVPAPQQQTSGAPQPAPTASATAGFSNLDDPPIRGSQDLIGAGDYPVVQGDGSVDSPSTAPGQTEDGDLGLYLDFNSVENPQPNRGTQGGDDPGPRNYNYDKINSDIFAPPATDSGSVPGAKWPMGLSHNRLGLNGAGWARNQNLDQLPAATAMAGVDMRLSPGAYRELHWHIANEWSLILNGSVRIQASNENGQTQIDDLSAGDVWFFPAGVPHSLQALDDGVEFLLVFDDGSFSEEETFLASELFLRNPKSVLAKDLNIDISALDNIPDDQLWIFNGTRAPDDIQEQNVTGAAGVIPKDESYSYHFSKQTPFEVDGGSVKIVDPVTFPIAKTFSAALVTVKPGAMREIHWHPTSDEWSFFLQGMARTTVFIAPTSSRTFDFSAGDVGYVPVASSHYIENVGDEDVVFLEVLQAPKFTDIAMGQWLALTPSQVVKDHLNLPDDVIANLSKQKQYIVQGHDNATSYTNATPGGIS
ncbi:MAG: hypothetical protein M4579_002728 [Chaenotheca gracillima]|nr:MAG: hypothetical protein M4579_002728 [Chaenotheca gracillima]